MKNLLISLCFFLVGCGITPWQKEQDARADALQQLERMKPDIEKALKPLAVFKQEWEQGTALPDWEAYQEVYKNTTNRKISFKHSAVDPDAIVATYEATMIRDGKPQTDEGLAVFYTKDDKVYYVEQVAVDGTDMALLGQAADLASTAVFLTQGFVEANPLGPLIVPLKIWALTESLEAPMLECIAWRQGLSSFGWGAAAWNIALVAGLNPVAGVVAAVVTGMSTGDREPAVRQCALAKLKANNVQSR